MRTQIAAWLIRFLQRLDFVKGMVNANDRTGAHHKAWGHIFTNQLKGDYIEFGVYKGDSLVNTYRQYQSFRKWLQRELKSPEKWRRQVAAAYQEHEPVFHGLDTFEGMPDNGEENLTFARGTFQTSYEEVLKKCKAAGIQDRQLRLYKGLFRDNQQLLQTALSGTKAAIVNIDGDLYESAVDALHMIEPFLQTGTVLLFDDYNTYNADHNKGERKAFREFLQTSSFLF
jgi:hypothetical protein